MFLNKFVSRYERERKRVEFEDLQQDDMSNAKYEVKFHASAGNALLILLIETQRMRSFPKGLIISIHLGVSQVTTSHVSFQKLVDAAKELEMIRCEGFEQHKANMAHHLVHLVGAPPKSRGYSWRGCHS